MNYAFKNNFVFLLFHLQHLFKFLFSSYWKENNLFITSGFDKKRGEIFLKPRLDLSLCIWLKIKTEKSYYLHIYLYLIIPKTVNFLCRELKTMEWL